MAYLEGSFINEGQASGAFIARGSGWRTLALKNFQGSLRIDGSFTLIGSNYLPAFQMGSSARLIVRDTLTLGPGPFSGLDRITIAGLLRTRLSQSGNFQFPSISLNGIQQVDSLRTLLLEHAGYSSPPGFANAAMLWWRFVPDDTSARANQLVLHYSDAQIRGIPEDSLVVFYSPDELSWQAFPGGIVRDAAANRITLSNAPLRGIYALAALGASPIEGVPAIHIEVAGRPTVRIGAPNRYTIFYTNLGRENSGPILLEFFYNPDFVRLDYVEVMPLGGGSAIRLPADSVLIQPGHIALIGYPLNFGESASFDIVFTGLPGALGKTGDEVEIVPLIVGTIVRAVAFRAAPLVWNAVRAGAQRAIPFLASATQRAIQGLRPVSQQASRLLPYAARVGAGVGLDVVLSYFSELCTELWRPVGFDADLAQELNDAMAVAAAKTLEKWTHWQTPALSVVTNSLPPNLSVPIQAGQVGYNVFDCLFMSGPQRYFDGLCQEEPWRCGDNEGTFEWQPVRSWDPNEKTGPAGIGSGHFLAEVGTLHYKIFFENLATATAPAYRIVIVDTLAPELDPESVEFGATSHQGWQITRNGNILRWEIEGIELPPNVNPPEGEGFVSFSVRPRPGVIVDGTRIENRATIVFDMNPPIVTNTVFNTFDLSPPSIRLAPLPEETDRDTVVLRWQAQDAGSGVARVFIFRSTDGGPFEQIATVAGNVDSLQIALEPGRSYTFYALAQDFVSNTTPQRSNEVSTRRFIVSTEPTAAELPDRFVLDGVYPNPFRTQVTFRIGLPRQDKVRLIVYDILGREVARIVDGEMPAGWHELRWHEPGLASGLYLVRFEAGKTQQVRTFLKVR